LFAIGCGLGVIVRPRIPFKTGLSNLAVCLPLHARIRLAHHFRQGLNLFCGGDIARADLTVWKVVVDLVVLEKETVAHLWGLLRFPWLFSLLLSTLWMLLQVLES
jgi:hypothetical protein